MYLVLIVLLLSVSLVEQMGLSMFHDFLTITLSKFLNLDLGQNNKD